MKNLILVVIIFAFIGCSKDDENSIPIFDCQEDTENFKNYNGEDLECQFYYILTEYNGQQYIELNSNCADLTRSHVINEDCEDICENDPYDENSECGKYLDSREIIKIILIEK